MTFTKWSSATVLFVFLFSIIAKTDVQETLIAGIFLQMNLYVYFIQQESDGEYASAEVKSTRGERIIGVSVPTIVIQIVLLVLTILDGKTEHLLRGSGIILLSCFLYYEGRRIMLGKKLIIPIHVHKKPEAK